MEETINWVDVKDQLPDDEFTVLVFHPSLNEPVWLGYHREGGWFTPDHYWLMDGVTHWAEIPAGPKEITT